MENCHTKKFQDVLIWPQKKIRNVEEMLELENQEDMSALK